jgi:hypothetical protein
MYGTKCAWLDSNSSSAIPEVQMPTKRRIILFLIVLAVMLLVKYAVGQDAGGDVVGWDREAGLSLEGYIEATMVAGVLWGGLAGMVRVRGRNIAASKGQYFTGDLVCLQL